VGSLEVSENIIEMGELNVKEPLIFQLKAGRDREAGRGQEGSSEHVRPGGNPSKKILNAVNTVNDSDEDPQDQQGDDDKLDLEGELGQDVWSNQKGKGDWDIEFERGQERGGKSVRLGGNPSQKMLKKTGGARGRQPPGESRAPGESRVSWRASGSSSQRR
jgi:hypothetical protein